ncbi:MsnO8 family LLM class oxidoreductase [Paenibacillus radicis (ex Gao et al. 2016)]|uniref:Alkanal monooxygenase n=1 Tax=Paenibacillus radicis (ex Gao et al. 2016) TaxID=1737354 RepID=A0A917H983_9BACL|nr:MsnO8 family LLM class oxidoreductase [Paenibacillus radicis (ex Gao et al. 2016)]GGG72097.1 alkanal monooxygenase [Paenibacillus radicis (ex Gao et al. 2016)]
MAIRLGILDQSVVFPGLSPQDTLRYTVELAQLAERLGYESFWVSEHHGTPFSAGPSPEVLAAYLLASTSKIRIGSGGVMLQHYSPYKVAENFNVLSTLAPGRVDLGVGRAPGGMPLATKALQSGKEQQTLEDKLAELDVYLYGPAGEEHPLAGLQAAPLPSVPAEVYVLGTSADSAELAARLGYRYAYALSIHNNPEVAAAAFAAYRAQFQALRGRQPEALLGIAVVVAPTDEEAAELAGEGVNVRITFEDGQTVNVTSLEQAEIFAKQAGKAYTTEVKKSFVVHGSPASVRQQLLELKEKYQVDGFIASNHIADVEKRFRSFELLYEAASSIEPYAVQA